MQPETASEFRLRKLREYCTQNQEKYNSALQTHYSSSSPRNINDANNEIINIVMNGCNGLTQDAMTICALFSVNPTVKNIVRNDLEFMQHDHISNGMLQTIMYSRESADEFYKIVDSSISKVDLCQRLRNSGHLCNVSDVQNMLLILAEKEFHSSANKSFAIASEIYQKWNVANTDTSQDMANIIFNSRCSVHRRTQRAAILAQFPPIIAKMPTQPDKIVKISMKYDKSADTRGQKRTTAYDDYEIQDDKKHLTVMMEAQDQCIKLHGDLIDSIDQSGKITYERVKKLSEKLEKATDDIDSLYHKISIMKDQMLKMAHTNNILLHKITELEKPQ